MKKFRTSFILLAILLSRELLAAAAPAGYVVCWGYGIALESPSLPSTGLVTISGQVLTNAIAVSAGVRHGLALRTDGTVVGWGLNNCGQALGSASINPDRASGVVKIDGQILSNVVAIGATRYHSEALKSDGSAVTWGTQFDGSKINLATGMSNLVSVTGWHNMGLKSDGTVVNIQNGRIYNLLGNIVAISATRSDYCQLVALKRDGTVTESKLFANFNGQGMIELKWPADISPVTIPVSNVVAIAAGESWKLALKSDGTIYEWGNEGDVPVPSGLSNVVAIAAGRRHNLALKKDGTVTMWGYFRTNALAVPAGLSNVVAIAAGDEFFLAVTTNRAVADKFRH